MKRCRGVDEEGSPSFADVQPLDLEKLADDLELSEQVRHSVQQIVEEWDDTPPSSHSSPSKSAFSAHPIRLWASIRRLWNAVVPAEQQAEHTLDVPTPSTRSLLSSRTNGAFRHPRQHVASSNSSRAKRFFTAAEKQKAVSKPSLQNNPPAHSNVDPFFTPRDQQNPPVSTTLSSHASTRNNALPRLSNRRLPSTRNAHRASTAASRYGMRPNARILQQAMTDNRPLGNTQPPTSPFSHVTTSTTPLSTPPKSPILVSHPSLSNKPKVSQQPLSKSSSFTSKVTSSSEQSSSMQTPHVSPRSPPPPPALQAPPYQLHEQLSTLTLVDPPPSETTLDDFFDADIDDSAVATNAFPTDDDISTLRLLRNRSRSTPEPHRTKPQSPTPPERAPSMRRLHSSRTVMRVARAAVQDVERLASLRRRITGDMRVDRRLAHLRLLQSQLRARRARLPSTEGAKERVTGALDRLRERKRQALIEQQRQLSSSFRVPKLGDVPRNVKLPPLRRASRRPKLQRMNSSPTDIRRTSYVG